MEFRVRDALTMARRSRRSALAHGGLGGIALGVFGALAARPGAARDWRDATPQPDAPAAPAATAAFPGDLGGLPPFAYRLEASAPQLLPAGNLRWASQRQLPTLDGVALASQRLAPGALRELHWHLNAHELGYCLAGEGRMGVFSSDGGGDTFDIRPGSITFIPEGYTHFIENTGGDELHVLLAFTDEQPETLDLSQSLPGFPLPLLAQTFGVTADRFPFLPIQGDRGIVPLPPEPTTATVPAAATPRAAASTAPYTIATDQVPVVEFAGGSVRPLRREQLSRLEGITVFPLHAEPGALREPHWHPGTAELNYCVSGQAQIGLVAPAGGVQTVAVDPGTVAFIPQNWIHYIANVGPDPLEFLVFFVNPDAEAPHIDLSQTVDFFPANVVAASFGTDPAAFAALPRRGDVFLAAPVDETR